MTDKNHIFTGVFYILSLILAIIILYSFIPPKPIHFTEIEYGLNVDSQTPNKMDAFTVTVYLRNNHRNTVRIAPFFYNFDIMENATKRYHIKQAVEQPLVLTIRPGETYVLRRETVFPDTKRVFLIYAFNQESLLEVEGPYTGLSHENFMMKQGVNVNLDKYEYIQGETPKLKIKNGGDSGISIGVGYGLQQYVNGSWVRYSPIFPGGDAFIMIGIGIQSSGAYSHQIPVSHLEGGFYRVIKDVYFNDNKHDTKFYFEKNYNSLNYYVEFSLLSEVS